MEFRGNLADTGIIGRRYKAEITAVDQSAGRFKLRVIENVEELKAKIEVQALRDMSILGQSHVPVVQTRTAKEPALRIAELAEVLQTEKVAPDVAPREVVASLVVEQPGRDSSRNS